MRIDLFISEEDTASQLRGIGLAVSVIAKRHDAVESKAVEVEVTTGDFTPVGPDK